MANTYASTPVLSKVQIGEQVYYLKDADVRALLDTYGDVVSYNVDASTVSQDANKIPTSKAVQDYINSKVEGLASALTFQGESTTDPATGIVTIGGVVITANAGDVVLYGTKEFISDGTNWIELGDEGIYLTIAAAENGYVKKTVTIAGVDLADDITVAELQAALTLKALAYKDSATATLTDYATGITGAEYTPAGSVTVALTSTATPMTSTGDYTPAGTVSAPTVTVTPSTTIVKHVTSVGTLPSVTEAKSAFATEGMVAAIDETDTEMLVLSAAGTSNALTGTGFNAGTLPTLEEEGTTVVTGITGATATAPTFTGTAAEISVSGNYDKAGVDAAGTSFTGTLATITPTLTTGTKVITVE